MDRDELLYRIQIYDNETSQSEKAMETLMRQRFQSIQYITKHDLDAIIQRRARTIS
jgi:hypothetical protein